MLGIDFGASLTKFCYIDKDGLTHYKHMSSNHEITSEFIKNELPKFCSSGINKCCVTGCGSYKYSKFIQESLNSPVRISESKILAFGIQEIMEKKINYRCLGGTGQENFQKDFLVVSIGTGVSFFKHSANHACEHIGGSAVGGGTFLGLSNLIIHKRDFSELYGMSKRGNPSNLDLLISDIVGRKNFIGNLTSDIVASAMAKCFWTEEKPNELDTVASLLKTICLTIGLQISSACHTNDIDTCILIGGFLDSDSIISKNIVESINVFAPNVTAVIPENYHNFGAYCSAISNQ